MNGKCDHSSESSFSSTFQTNKQTNNVDGRRPWVAQSSVDNNNYFNIEPDCLNILKLNLLICTLSRQMFFTNKNPEKNSIMRATMGGADSLTLFSAESPGDLAVDKEGKKLFWTDTKLKKIEYGDLTGRVSFVCYTLVTLSL